MEEWRQILQPRLTEIQNDMKLDKKNITRWRRNYISVADKRESARYHFENVALGKESRQSSIYWNLSLKYGPHLANDGKRNTIFKDGGCSHTEVDTDVFWWAVDLEVESIIEILTIYGPNRLRDFDVLVYNPTDASWEGTPTLCYHQTGVAPTILNVTCVDENTRGRFVKINMTKNNDVENHCLTLCEVEVYGRKTSVEPDCQCSCENKQNEESKTSQIIQKHSKEELRIILQPRLTELQNEIKLDTKNVSRWKRNLISAADKRESARYIGIVGVVVLCAVVGTVVLLDLLSLQEHIRQIRRIRCQ
ncbi:unnamed protein product [Mytilus coruscus]|uniref:Fucolectin tachylectin-4 pentraxin-1 domain-containing protein n=1 Tax=Mytilus coruscus TaxID=42192 RepID=A0A6J8EG48_MYTCO|nr:unnamed protein product [Mytilus coruscus]